MIVTNHELPTPARLSEPFIRRPSNPLDGIFTRLENHDLVSLFFDPQGLSPSPWLEPLLKKEQSYRIERRDYSSRKSFLGLKYYADEPPSIWTSTSRCIQLYAHNTSRGATPMPLAELVRLDLPGVLARIN